MSDSQITALGVRNGLELAIAHRSGKTLGKIITQPDSSDLIEGVQIDALHVFADDRGSFTELSRLGRSGLDEKMVPSGNRQIQISATRNYPGTIKAIHYHYEQTDLWAPIGGMLQVFLCDLRRASKTFGLINTLYVGELRPWRILIPPGVGHGYKVLGTQSAELVYLTDRYYNPADEGRLPYNSPEIGYDWEIQYK